MNDIPTSPQSTGLSRGAMITLIVWPLFIGCLVGYVTFTYFKAQLIVELSGRPPIAVIDLKDYVAKYNDVDRGLIEARAAATQLESAGFVVFDTNQVYLSPDQVKVKPQ